MGRHTGEERTDARGADPIKSFLKQLIQKVLSRHCDIGETPLAFPVQFSGRADGRRKKENGRRAIKTTATQSRGHNQSALAKGQKAGEARKA